MTDARSLPAPFRRLSPISENDRGLVLFDLLDERRHAHMTGDSDKDHSLNAFFAWALPRVSTAKAQLFQDLWVLWELGAPRGGYFVEFGAGDGVELSNTHLLEKQFGWSGILAEPNPLYHDRVARARNCHISHKCVFSHSGTPMPFACTELPQLSRLVDVIPEDNHEARGRRKVVQMIEAESVLLDDLLDEFNAPPHIDYISIDTEGSELEILQSFDFSRRTVTLFTVEHNRTPLREAIFNLLTAQGYERRFTEYSRFDDWYVRPDLV